MGGCGDVKALISITQSEGMELAQLGLCLCVCVLSDNGAQKITHDIRRFTEVRKLPNGSGQHSLALWLLKNMQRLQRRGWGGWKGGRGGKLLGQV